MTFKTRPPKQPAVTCRGPQACHVQKCPQEWAAGTAHQTFSRGHPREQSAHLPGSESCATPVRDRRSAKAPPPQLGRLPRPHRLSPQARSTTASLALGSSRQPSRRPQP